jgi:hypothetical protein
VLTLDQARQALQELSLAVRDALLCDRRDGLAWLATLTPDELVRLDDVARGANSWRGPAIGGKPDPLESTGLGAVLASMHYDGYLRERALDQLPAELGAAFLAIRTADHVPQVRTRARELLLRLPYSGERATGVLLVVQGRLNAAELLNDYADQLTAEQFADLRRADFRALRRWSYQRALSEGTLTIEELEAGALDDDQWLRARCADSLAQRADADLAPRLLTSRYVETRMAGLVRLPDELLDEAEIERALFDPSARVRELAQWRCRRRGGDPAQLYRDASADRRTDAKVYGLIATGSADDLPLVEPHLADAKPAVRSAAAKAVATWVGGETRARLLGPLLLDISSKVVGSVVPALAGLPPSTTDAYTAAAWASDQPWSRRGVMRLAILRGPWDGLEAVLHFIVDPDPALAKLAHANLAIWLRSSGAAGSRLPDDEQKARLRRLLSKAAVDAATARQITFYARLQA